MSKLFAAHELRYEHRIMYAKRSKGTRINRCIKYLQWRVVMTAEARPKIPVIEMVSGSFDERMKMRPDLRQQFGCVKESAPGHGV
jgi:hypothetical protein